MLKYSIFLTKSSRTRVLILSTFSSLVIITSFHRGWGRGPPLCFHKHYHLRSSTFVFCRCELKKLLTAQTIKTLDKPPGKIDEQHVSKERRKTWLTGDTWGRVDESKTAPTWIGSSLSSTPSRLLTRRKRSLSPLTYPRGLIFLPWQLLLF